MNTISKIPKVLLLIETSREYGRNLVQGISRYALGQGPWSIYFTERGLNDPFPRWLWSWEGNGIIARTTRQANVERLKELDIPVVELLAPDTDGLSSVFASQKKIARLAAEHFWDRNIPHFGFFAPGQDKWLTERRDAFIAVLAEKKLLCHTFTPEAGGLKSVPRTYESMLVKWLQTIPKPCGIFCGSDLFALQLLEICREQEIPVPEAIAVLGVDNDPIFCNVGYPPLSSIDLNATQVGFEAASLLDRMMKRETSHWSHHIEVEPKAVIARQSTDILAVSDVIVAQSIRFIRQNAAHKISVQEVADAVIVSRRVLERHFKKSLQRTVKEEILRSHIERAKELLRETTMNIENICFKSGFNSLTYFSRAFRREVDMTPREYRKQNLFF